MLRGEAGEAKARAGLRRVREGSSNGGRRRLRRRWRRRRSSLLLCAAAAASCSRLRDLHDEDGRLLAAAGPSPSRSPSRRRRSSSVSMRNSGKGSAPRLGRRRRRRPEPWRRAAGVGARLQAAEREGDRLGHGRRARPHRSKDGVAQERDARGRDGREGERGGRGSESGRRAPSTGRRQENVGRRRPEQGVADAQRSLLSCLPPQPLDVGALAGGIEVEEVDNSRRGGERRQQGVEGVDGSGSERRDGRRCRRLISRPCPSDPASREAAPRPEDAGADVDDVGAEAAHGAGAQGAVEGVRPAEGEDDGRQRRRQRRRRAASIVGVFAAAAGIVAVFFSTKELCRAARCVVTRSRIDRTPSEKQGEHPPLLTAERHASCFSPSRQVKEIGVERKNEF